MCGIAGYQGAREGFEPALLDAMGAAIAHRGPDDDGAWWAEGVGLAHRRLSILDTSAAGHQPMASADSRHHIVYNGEIYNFRALRRELAARGHRFRSHSDTEVILALYAEEGLAMLGRLDGIFALALWDAPARRLLLARDGLGVKPLYYSELPGGGLVFASELKALLCCPQLPRTLDKVALHHHLAFLWAPAPRTMLEGVRKLEPGAALVVEDGRVRGRLCFYELPSPRVTARRPRAELAAAVREEVAAAVERQLVSDVPVGAFLSGGLDSSAVVAMMARAGVSDLRCYSIGFGEPDLDGAPADLPFARQVARHVPGVRLCELRVDPTMIDHLERTLYHLDEPQADPAPINTLLIAKAAREDGIKVLLSGTGGDDVFSGYRRHQALALERLFRRIPAPLRHRLARWARGLPPRTAWRRRAGKLLANLDLTPGDRLLAQFLWSSEPLRRSLYTDALAAELRDVDTLAPLRATLAALDGVDAPLERALRLELRHFLADHNLNYTDKAAMAEGVEVRVPLLDRALVELAATIPPEEKLRGGVAKAIFKTAMEPVLPRAIITRPKTGFGAPVRGWIRGRLRERVDDLLSPSALRDRGLFNPDAVTRLIAADRDGQLDGAYLIFALLCVELWLRMFLDDARPPFPRVTLDRIEL
ncbi:MAG: asparagine synthase (glutamine-hydrolyzing) [Nannocystaceae bacterium]